MKRRSPLDAQVVIAQHPAISVFNLVTSRAERSQNRGIHVPFPQWQRIKDGKNCPVSLSLKSSILFGEIPIRGDTDENPENYEDAVLIRRLP